MLDRPLIPPRECCGEVSEGAKIGSFVSSAPLLLSRVKRVSFSETVAIFTKLSVSPDVCWCVSLDPMYRFTSDCGLPEGCFYWVSLFAEDC